MLKIMIMSKIMDNYGGKTCQLDWKYINSNLQPIYIYTYIKLKFSTRKGTKNISSSRFFKGFLKFGKKREEKNINRIMYGFIIDLNEKRNCMDKFVCVYIYYVIIIFLHFIIFQCSSMVKLS